MIRMKQMADGYGPIGVDFENPDFAMYANSFGAKGHRLDDPSLLRSTLDQAAADGGVHVIDVPIDARQNGLLMKEMMSVDCAKLS